MGRILTGITLNVLLLEIGWLGALLHFVGAMLIVLGFRRLYSENRWFRLGLVLGMIRLALISANIVLNTTVLYLENVRPLLQWGSTAAMLLLLFCFWRGMEKEQCRAGLPPGCASAALLSIWYGGMVLLALSQGTGSFPALLMFLFYVLILFRLYRQGRNLQQAGGLLPALPAKIPDWLLSVLAGVILLSGCGAGYLLGGSCRMDWKEVRAGEHEEIEGTEEELLRLGFPEEILGDISAADIEACKGAESLQVSSTDCPAGWNGRSRNLRFTAIAVKLSGEKEQRRIFHHFRWLETPGFYGTEAIQIWTAGGSALENNSRQISGRLLYDAEGITYEASYRSLGGEICGSDDSIWKLGTQTNIWAGFSLPETGENQRGYIAYTTENKAAEDMPMESWINYTYQRSWKQYPAVTALEYSLPGEKTADPVFRMVQDSITVR